MALSASQVSFTGGEWAPSLHSRVDLSKYATALQLCKNFFVHTHGGVSNRAGTQFVNEVKDSSKVVRLIPFQFSTEQGYVLEFGDEYMRVYKDGAIVLHELGDVLAWVVTTVYNIGDFVKNGGLIYRCILGHTASAGDEPGVGGSWTTYWVQDDTYEIVTPYSETDLALLKFAQSYDVIFLAHPSYKPQELSRLDHNDWTIADVAFGALIAAPTSLAGGTGGTHSWAVSAISTDGEESLISNTHAAASGTLTWTAPATGTVDYYNVYMQKNLSGDYAWVARAASNSHVIDTSVSPDYGKTIPKGKTPFNAPDSYPGVVSFFEQRLIFGRTNNKPQTIWGSQTGNLRNFNDSVPLQSDDAYEFTLNARQVNEIRWFVPLESMVIGTSAGEWRLSAGGNSDAVTPTSVNLKLQSQWGVGHLRPLVIGDSVLFVGNAGITVRDLAYSLEADGYTGNDLTILANHLFEDRTIVDWAFQQFPDPIIWVVMSDGELLGLSYAREHEVWGWHRHETEGLVENVSVITSEAGNSDVYFCVKRAVDGSDYRYIETLHDRLVDRDVLNAWFLDSALEYNGWNLDTADTLELTGGSTWEVGESLTLTAVGHTPFAPGDVGRYYKLRSGTDSVIVEITAYTSSTVVTVTPFNRAVPASLRATAVWDWALTVTTLSGLGHLEAETVGVFGDGNVLLDKTVSSGSVTLEYPVAQVVIGLGFESEMDTLEVEIPLEGATMQDRFRNITEVTAQLQDTRGIFAGPADGTLDEVPFRTDELYGEPIELFTGNKQFPVEPGEGKTARLKIKTSSPIPVTVLAAIPRLTVGD